MWGIHITVVSVYTHLVIKDGGGNGSPLQCSCLENPRAGEPGGPPSPGSHRVGQNEATRQQQRLMMLSIFACAYCPFIDLLRRHVCSSLLSDNKADVFCWIVGLLKKIYLLLAALGLSCCARAFCSGGSGAVLHRDVWSLIAVSSLVAECGLRSWGAWA